jgi:hypothetical protein
MRQPEITQTFSLAMISPLELLNLRQNGFCTINIPKVAFEMFYPGQYRRIIKSVRISIPCVAGPYVNISARLTFNKGIIEREYKADPEERSITNNTSISSSSAINDAGVFDLNFHDERYLPFEGAGAISSWRLDLPRNIRAFNYDTISDVLLHISYTALECDGDKREAAENELASLITDNAAQDGFYRLVSLRYEFPDAFYKLFSQDAQKTSFDLTQAHFPFLLSSKILMFSQPTKVYIKPKRGAIASVHGTVNINGKNPVDWSDNSNNIPSGTAAPDQLKCGIVTLSGSPVTTWTIETGAKGIDKDKTEDVLILIQYKAS